MKRRQELKEFKRKTKRERFLKFLHGFIHSIHVKLLSQAQVAIAIDVEIEKCECLYSVLYFALHSPATRTFTVIIILPEESCVRERGGRRFADLLVLRPTAALQRAAADSRPELTTHPLSPRRPLNSHTRNFLAEQLASVSVTREHIAHRERQHATAALFVLNAQ